MLNIYKKYNYVKYIEIMLIISVWAYYLDFSHRRPPPISNHFVVYWGLSLMRELTVF